MRMLAAYAASLVAFVALDFVWLSLMVERIYRPALGDLLAAKPRMGAAVVFYLAYAAGLVFLVVAPALKEASLTRAGVGGLVLGAMAYATYDLTNQATLRTWSTKLTLVDIAWGAALTAVAAMIGYAVARLVAK
ncbi:DUF2177 family protein [Caulobacter sp.]|uniref:DUF2177 family protein n=1 Tax=Caulobacter sp. TaxID=78 RepID=UPI001AFF941B|nr:DUF2177 family protein [Caulobacter sp.]MBO9545769.1 DUF2177 family protein [Caulobacter sp.]